jgi:hypothetical protein
MATLELTVDGWQVNDPRSAQPLPVHVDFAWEIAERSSPGAGDEIMDATRRLCGQLRTEAKRDPVARQTLNDLRAGMERVRATKRELGLVPDWLKAAESS